MPEIVTTYADVYADIDARRVDQDVDLLQPLVDLAELIKAEDNDWN